MACWVPGRHVPRLGLNGIESSAPGGGMGPARVWGRGLQHKPPPWASDSDSRPSAAGCKPRAAAALASLPAAMGGRAGPPGPTGSFKLRVETWRRVRVPGRCRGMRTRGAAATQPGAEGSRRVPRTVTCPPRTPAHKTREGPTCRTVPEASPHRAQWTAGGTHLFEGIRGEMWA